MLVNTEDGAVGRKMRRQEARLPKTQIITENSKARGEAAERKKETVRGELLGQLRADFECVNTKPWSWLPLSSAGSGAWLPCRDVLF